MVTELSPIISNDRHCRRRWRHNKHYYCLTNVQSQILRSASLTQSQSYIFILFTFYFSCVALIGCHRCGCAATIMNATTTTFIPPVTHIMTSNPNATSIHQHHHHHCFHHFHHLSTTISIPTHYHHKTKSRQTLITTTATYTTIHHHHHTFHGQLHSLPYQQSHSPFTTFHQSLPSPQP